MQSDVQRLGIGLRVLRTLALLTVVVGGLVGKSAVVAGSTFTIEEGNFPIVDTGYVQGGRWDKSAVWLDNNRLLVNAVHEGYDWKGNPPGRVILYDFKAKTSKTIFTGGIVNCYSHEFGVFGVTPNEKKGRKFARVDSNGEFRPLDESESPNLYSGVCYSRDHPPSSRGHQIEPLRPGHGYINLGRLGTTLEERDKAILYRPGQAPQELPLSGKQIRVRYIPWLDKYILNDYDPKYISSLQGEPVDRPYLLMSPDGTLSEVPMPAEVSEFLGHNGWRKIDFLRPGLVVGDAGVGPGQRGLFLFRGKTLTRIWGKRGDFFEGSDTSPDGCKIASTSYRIDRGLFGTTESNHTLKIVNVCGNQ